MHRLAQVLGDAHGAGAIGVRQHHDELLAPAAAGEVAAAQLAAHEGAQCREDLVAALVAEGVVDLLEVIEVQQGSPTSASASGRPGRAGAWNARLRRPPSWTPG